MRYRIRDLPELLRTRAGRKSLLTGQLARFQPLIFLMALIWRRTFLRRTKVITVIGSLGKSTTAKAIALVTGNRLPDGNSNHGNALALELLGYRPRRGSAVLEAAVRNPGMMKSHSRMLSPDIVVVTSIASEHITSFLTLANTRKEKAEMLRRLKPEDLVILNIDDPNVRWMAGKTRARTINCGFDENADLRASNYRIDDKGEAGFLISTKDSCLSIRTGLIGRHMVFPFMAAFAVGRELGDSPGEIVSRLKKLKPLDGRMQIVETRSGALLLRDDFKSNKESIQAALNTLGEIPAKRKIFILGGVSEIQNRERYSYYRKLGSQIGSCADYALLFLEKNKFRPCRKSAVQAGMDPQKIMRMKGNPLAAVPFLPSDLGKGDILLIKGKTRHRTSRLSLQLCGRNVRCRIVPCHLPTVCSECELLGQNARESVLMGINRYYDNKAEYKVFPDSVHGSKIITPVFDSGIFIFHRAAELKKIDSISAKTWVD